MPARVTKLSDYSIEVTIFEGKKETDKKNDRGTRE